ncbi:MAG: HAD-IC family P-type ATPase [Armatimonadota bacterium]
MASRDQGLNQAGTALREARPDGTADIAFGLAFSEGMRRFGRAVSGPLVLVLLGAAALSGALGDRTGAAIVAAIVFVGAVLDMVQSGRAEMAARRLREHTAPRAEAWRSGAWSTVPVEALLPGDRVRLRPGDIVPADVVLRVADRLEVDEGALTGESSPSAKGATVAGEPEGGANTALKGTVVLSGSGEGEVRAVGGATAWGRIEAQLSGARTATAFERDMERLAGFLLRTVAALVGIVVVAGAVSGRDPLQTVLFAVAVAVGLTPEFLPMVTGVALAAASLRMARRKVLVRRPSASLDLGAMRILCSDKTGTLTRPGMRIVGWTEPDGVSVSPGVLAWARLNSRCQSGVRNAVDDAVLGLPIQEGEPDLAGAVEVNEIPFAFERRCISVSVDLPNGRHATVVKGAPEAVVPRCAAVGDAEHPMDGGARARIESVVERAGERGVRALAVAVAIDREPGGLVLIGFVLFENDPLPGAADALERLVRDGIEVKILTGDSEVLARSLCRAVGFEPGRIVLGEEVDRCDDRALAALAKHTRLFVRMSPTQKSRVLRALREHGAVVGFLGDGINDAPALRAADVGISAADATDVARATADILLLEHDLAVLHEGVIEGRRACANIVKYLLMNVSSNFGNMLSMAAATWVLPFLPLLPSQVLLNNFLYDLTQAALPADRVDPAVLRSPARQDLSRVRRFMWIAGPISSAFDALMFLGLRRWLHATPAEFRTAWFLESLASQVLVVLVIRTRGPVWKSRPPRVLAATLVLVLGVAAALPWTSAGRGLGFVPLPGLWFVVLAGTTLAYLGTIEVVKRRVPAA